MRLMLIKILFMSFPWSDPAPVQQAEPWGLCLTLLRSSGPGAPHYYVLHRPHTTCWATLQHGRQILQVPLSSEDEGEVGSKRRRKITGPKLQTDLKKRGAMDPSFINLCCLITSSRLLRCYITLTQISGLCSHSFFLFWKFSVRSRTL